MRKVMVLKTEYDRNVPVRTDDFTGTFHQWGVEGESGHICTVAIVEKDDGSVVTVASSEIRFLGR